MSACLNEVNLIGHLAKDPEIRVSQAGKQIGNLTVATNESWKDANGERKDKSEFHRVVIFSEGLVKVASAYLKKGAKVMVRGALQTRKWVDKEGVERYSTEVVLQGFDAKLIMLDGRGEKADNEGPRSRQATAPAGELLDDTVPF